MAKKGFNFVSARRGYPIDFSHFWPFLRNGAFIGSFSSKITNLDQCKANSLKKIESAPSLQQVSSASLMLYFSLDDAKCPCDIPEKQTQAVAADATSIAPMLLPQATKAPCGSNEAPPHAKCLCEIGGTQTQAIAAHASRQSSESSFRREKSLKRP